MSGRDLVLEKGGNKLTQWIDPRIEVDIDDSSVTFRRTGDDRRQRSLHGTYRSLAANMALGLDKAAL